MKINKMTFLRAKDRAVYELDKHSPEILLGLGIITFIGTVVTACHATLKADEVLDEHEKNVRKMEEAKTVADEHPEEELDYDDELYAADMRNEKIKTAVKLARLYAPVVALGTISVVSILTSRNIMQKRYLAVVTAYNGLTEVFATYRNRVRDELGETMDRHFRFGTELNEETHTEVGEDGKKKKVKETTENVEKFDISKDATCRWFDESNHGYWDENPTLSMMTLRAKASKWNAVLLSRGYVFLNEVLDDMGFEQCQEGARLGWMKNGPVSGGYIDFGLARPDDQTRRFVNGQSNIVLLEFNVDGIIWDKLPKAKDVRGAA